jgi:XTP/dITP diphosphohydrolase
MQILIATQNSTKVERIRGILNSLYSPFELISLNDFNVPEPDEPYNTFAENALHKANYYCNITGLATLSEDSGLCINALNGFPGVRTKEFKDASGGIAAACADLQFRLKNFPDHTAYFISAACIVFPGTNKILASEGRLNGTISIAPFKDLGFDFERIFIADGQDKTLAEIDVRDKSHISHRYKAIKNLYEQLYSCISIWVINWYNIGDNTLLWSDFL